jgi:NAD(P)-dependent dehydrogenase (short-subunit alcohol dehydrogenase family)
MSSEAPPLTAVSTAVAAWPASGVRGDVSALDQGSHAGGEVPVPPVVEVGSPDAIASAAVYLASDEASFVHGIVLDVDGGRTTTAVIAR